MNNKTIFSLTLCLVAPLANSASVTINDSAGPASYYTNPTASEPELHIISVYETRSDHGGGYHPQGTATLNINYGGNSPITLVLSSYEPTMWNFNIESGAVIDQVILNGYHNQEASGIDSNLLINRSGVGNYFSACAYTWPSDDQGCDTPSLVSGAEDFTDLTLSSFSASYRATDFTIETSPVPVPASLWLFGSGLLGLFGFKKTVELVPPKNANKTI